MSVKERIKSIVGLKVELLAAVTMVVCLIVALIFASDDSKVLQSKDYNVTQANTYSDMRDVSMSLDKVYINEKNQLVADVTWKKTSLANYMFGEPFSLHTLVDGEWKPCILEDGVAFIAIGYSFSYKRTHTYILLVYTDELKEGATYKLDAGVSIPGGQEKHFGVEFVVNKASDFSKKPVVWDLYPLTSFRMPAFPLMIDMGEEYTHVHVSTTEDCW